MPSSQFIGSNTPTPENISQTLTDIYTRYQAVEEVRWNESNIDLRFWAGDQNYVYQYFSFTPNYSFQNFYFNIIQQPCNLVTGYQRQHRKSINYIPVEGADQQTADQFNKVITFANNKKSISEKMSEAYEASLVTGMCLVQPYMDYTKDPVNGDLDIKIWHYNSFMMDPYWREPDMSDANWVWIQKYLSKEEAKSAFPEYSDLIDTMGGYSNREGRFYFLPENYNIARNDLLVLSYYWYRTTRKKKSLYNRKTGEITEFIDNPENIKEYLEVFKDLEEVEIEVPTWNVATVLNETTLYMGKNPLNFDECPFVPIYWNYDPQIAQYNLRVRSLVRTLRDVNFLFNRRIILNHDISESSLNTGWIYKENSLANEENIKFAGQGKDLIVKDGYELTDIQKIIPNAVPPSDMQLADQLMQLGPLLSGVNEELAGSAVDDKAGILSLLRQGAGLVTLQKYFDQWDRALKHLGTLEMKIIQANWSPFKVSRIINEEPTEQFFSKNFQIYDVQVAEGLDTVVQRQNEFRQLLELQQVTGIQIPPELLLKNSTLQGKDELIEVLSKQQEQQGEMQQQQAQLQLAQLEQQLQNIQADTAQKLALARERVGRTKSNVGLFEERLSEVTQNRAKALREKIGALKELLETLALFGDTGTAQGERTLERVASGMEMDEDREKLEARVESIADEGAMKAQGQLQKSIS